MLRQQVFVGESFLGMEEHATVAQEESELVFKVGLGSSFEGDRKGYVAGDRIANHPRCPEGKRLPRVI